MNTEAPVTISTRNGHAYCLVCGDRNPWSLKLCFNSGEDDIAWARFRVGTRLQGYDGILHGGMVAALLDAAMTHCLFHHGVQAVTADLQVRFLKPISCDASVDIRAWVLSTTRSLHRLRAELVHEDCLMAWAEAKFLERRISR